MKFLSLAGRL